MRNEECYIYDDKIEKNSSFDSNNEDGEEPSFLRKIKRMYIRRVKEAWIVYPVIVISGDVEDDNQHKRVNMETYFNGTSF